MGIFKLRIKEFADEKGWTLKEVAARSGVPYTTITTYARSPGMATADLSAVQKIARIFDVMIEDLLEVIE